MAEEVRWLKGELVGTCVGKPHRKVGGSGLARWYSLTLVDATISNWTMVDGPPKTSPDGQAPFCQAALKDARLRSVTAGATDEALSLGELSVWNWKMRDQREGGGESRCTLVGTVYAREVSGTRRPAGADGEGRLGQWGCLAVMLAVLVALWLWWSCGPFTSGLWAAVVLASAWSHRLRTRRRTPPALWSQVLQSVLALLLIIGGVGLTLGLADSAPASTCGDDLASLVVLGAVAVVVAGSLLTVSWQLPWVWMVWTVVVVMWCGRSGTDCVASWLKRAQAVVSPSAPRRVTVLDELRRRVNGEPNLPEGAGPARTGDDGSRGPGIGGPGIGGTDDGGTGTGGTGTGGTDTGGTGTGGTDTGGTGTGGTGTGGTGTGGTGTSGTDTGGTDTGGTGTGSTGGTGTGGTGTGGTGTGGTGIGGTGTGSIGGERGGATTTLNPGDEEVPAAAREARMTVEAAMNDPKPFLDGSTRITLSGDLLFAFDEDVLKPGAEPHLRQVSRLLRDDPASRVLLEGHADTVGGDQYNQDLSERRAQAVRSWLVQEAHINPLRIDTVGYGNARPIVPASKSPAQQQPNRRVEVLIQR